MTLDPPFHLVLGQVYTLSKIPDETCVVRGDLGGRGEGVIGVMSGEGIESQDGVMVSGTIERSLCGGNMM